MKGESSPITTLLSIILFIVIVAYFYGQIAGIELVLFNPLAIGSIVVLFIAAIAAGNTPVVRGGAVAALVIVFSAILIYDFAQIIPQDSFVIFFGLILAPLIITLYFIFLEASKA